jgi:seryl-tRNA synthetase
LVGDLTRWVEACRSIAAGREPDGATLAELAAIAERLSLPHNSLADDVAALVEHKRLVDKAAAKRAEREALEAQSPELKKALDHAKKEVERITLLFRRIHALTSSEVGIDHDARRVAENHPRLFKPADRVADDWIAEKARRSGQAVSTGATT